MMPFTTPAVDARELGAHVLLMTAWCASIPCWLGMMPIVPEPTMCQRSQRVTRYTARNHSAYARSPEEIQWSVTMTLILLNCACEREQSGEGEAELDHFKVELFRVRQQGPFLAGLAHQVRPARDNLMAGHSCRNADAIASEWSRLPNATRTSTSKNVIALVRMHLNICA